jgi:hypothetical protein
MLTPSQSGAISHVPSDVDTASPASSKETSIQRQITPLPGKSSGLFKGRRDKINALVVAYNALEVKTTSARFALAAYQKLIADVQKIKVAAAAWQASVASSKPDKAASIGTWITTELDRETTAKQSLIDKTPEGMKAASDGAAYNALYATPEYTVSAGTRWLETPPLAPIYKYFMIQQHEEAPLSAFEDMKRYRQNPSRAEAIALYDKYEMSAADRLNITGEGVKGGIASINAVRQQIAALRADASAPVPPNFGAIELSINYVINSMFLTFANTEAFKKITTPPK